VNIRRAISRWSCLAALIVGASEAVALDYALENPAPGVYVHYGRQEDISAANRGDISNSGFVVGDKCVAVIDTGGSFAVGVALRESVRRATDRPVCFVINTHAHPDHIFGNAAFAGDKPQFIGHVRLPEAIRRRGPNYLNALNRTLGTAAQGTTLVLPTRAVAGIDRVDLGGRTLVLRAWRTAHTDCDLTVLDEKSGTLWLGDLAFEGHVPVLDGNLRGYLAVIAELRALRVNQVVPGHGRAAGWPGVLDAQERYLRRLLADVTSALKARKTLAETLDAAECAERGEWLLFDLFHKRNVSAAYAELEWDE